ncbi:MAG: stage IV sporulation protein A [Clostridia bacterium]|nr:stage IV sporulation protein A [Clostridia bacterium]
MANYDVYKDIEARCDGDIYVGIVGPVRTGKSTFAAKFMENVIIPNVSSKNVRDRIKDQIPQSGSGKAVTTTEPKFIPGQAVALKLGKAVSMNVRVIDCVGYPVEGATFGEVGEKTRMFKTPWSTEEMSFEEAAELGTSKVITEHSNVAVMITCDGTISDIERANYERAEEKTVIELKQSGKPFVIVLNSKNPNGEFAKNLAVDLSNKYETTVLPKNLAKLDKEGVESIFAGILNEFPITSIEIDIPKWMQALPYDNEIIADICDRLKVNLNNLEKIGQNEWLKQAFSESEYLDSVDVSANMGTGEIKCVLRAKEGLFYKVLSNRFNVDIADDFALFSYLSELLAAKSEYDKIKEALDEVKLNGYGVVAPQLSEMSLEEPEVVKKNGQFGVRLKASAPTMHIMRVDVDTEINPIVSTEQQGEELVKTLLSDFENDPKSLWNTNMFGKPLNLLVKDGLNNKLYAMPSDVKVKLRKSVGKIVNENKGGVICIVL